jgi:hypothetical protein
MARLLVPPKNYRLRRRLAYQSLQRGGATSLRAIAKGLNDASIPAARGEGEWSASQVRSVLRRPTIKSRMWVEPAGINRTFGAVLPGHLMLGVEPTVAPVG